MASSVHDDGEERSGPVARALERFVSDVALGPARRPKRSHAELDEPGGRSRVPSRRRAVAYVLAVALPAVVAAAMIPVHADHGRTTAIVLVVPVVAVAALGATGPAVVAALSAGLSYDFFLTEPYYRLAIDDSDDVVAAVTLVVVGLIVGVLSSRLVRFTARALRPGAPSCVISSTSCRRARGPCRRPSSLTRRAATSPACST